MFIEVQGESFKDYLFGLANGSAFQVSGSRLTRLICSYKPGKSSGI